MPWQYAPLSDSHHLLLYLCTHFTKWNMIFFLSSLFFTGQCSHQASKPCSDTFNVNFVYLPTDKMPPLLLTWKLQMTPGLKTRIIVKGIAKRNVSQFGKVAVLSRPCWNLTANAAATDGRVRLRLARTLNTFLDTAFLVTRKASE